MPRPQPPRVPTWKDGPHGTRVLTKLALEIHIRGLLDAGFTVTQAKTVVLPWAIPHEVEDVLDKINDKNNPDPRLSP